MRLGIDVSTYFEELDHGAVYYDGDKQVEPLSLIRGNGADIMRIRLWVHPYDESGKPYLAGTCDLNNFIKLAKLAEQKGFDVMLDFHYSDFWCDPAKQRIPKSWEHGDIDKLAATVYDYTVSTLKTIKEQGITVKFIQVGNEVTNGFLWPLGEIKRAENSPLGESFDGFKKLLNMGIKACREVAPQASLVLHLERSYDQDLYNDFYSHMTDVDYDIIGFSYYPYWHGTFDQLFANVENLKKFGKRLMCVELGYGFTVEDYMKNAHGSAHLVVDVTVAESLGFTHDYPLTPEGQAKFVKDFLARAEKHGLEAVCYWEPLWIPGDGICWASIEAQKYLNAGEPKEARNEWANQCLFDYEGRKLPAFDEFKIKSKK